MVSKCLEFYEKTGRLDNTAVKKNHLYHAAYVTQIANADTNTSNENGNRPKSCHLVVELCVMMKGFLKELKECKWLSPLNRS